MEHVSLSVTGEGGFETRPYRTPSHWIPAPYQVRGRLFAGMTDYGRIPPRGLAGQEGLVAEEGYYGLVDVHGGAA